MSKIEKSRRWIGSRYEVAIPRKEKPPQEARSCETLQRSNECECREGLQSEVRI